MAFINIYKIKAFKLNATMINANFVSTKKNVQYIMT